MPRTIGSRVSPAARVRAPGGLIDEVGAAASIDEARQASRLAHSIKKYLNDGVRRGSSTGPAAYAGGPWTGGVSPGGFGGRASAV